jgi:hypothetical protein
MPRLSDDAKPQLRITLPLNAEGTAVDWEHVRPSVAERFEGLLQTDENIKKAYQEVHGGGPELPPEFAISEENVRKLLDGIASINAFVFQFVAAKWIPHPLKFTGPDGKPLHFVIEPDIMQGMQFTSAQHRELDPIGVRIAKKYEDALPSWLKENFDVYVFGAMFIAYSAENAKAVIMAQVGRDLGRAQQAFAKARGRTVDGTPIPVEGPPPGPPPAAAPTNGVDQSPPPPPETPGEEQPPIV